MSLERYTRLLMDTSSAFPIHFLKIYRYRVQQGNVMGHGMEGLQDKCAIVGVGEQEPPRIPGLDVAGVVASVEANVANWHPGDHVMALVRGAYAAYAVAPSVLTFRLPVGMSTTDAASLPCVFFTAALSSC